MENKKIKAGLNSIQYMLDVITKDAAAGHYSKILSGLAIITSSIQKVKQQAFKETLLKNQQTHKDGQS